MWTNLSRTDLNQDVLLGVEMERRHRAGGGDEDEALEVLELLGAGAGGARHLGQESMEETAVGGVPLDTLDDEPGIGILDAADDLLGRHAQAGDVLGPDARLDPAG